LVDLRNQHTRAEALAELREYLLRAVFLYLDRHREDLSHLSLRDLEHMAEDFAQEALLQIQAKLHTFRGRSKFTTWAYPFVINIAAGELRLHRWRDVSMDALVSEQEVPLFAFLSDERAPSPETMLARNQIIALIHQIIDEELTERQRIALLGVHFHGQPVAKVAERLDTTPNNVYKLVHDARKKLKSALMRRRYSLADILAIFGEH
jgi:RNA polymerase sigma-70 factor (ECF subfamily)